jgi:transcriptional regulator of NAD metabolism
MTTNDRRHEIEIIIRESKNPVSGSELAKKLGVSRQVIVQDIAILRALNPEIMSTNKGYVFSKKAVPTQIYKVHHSDEELGEELNTIVDGGGKILNVFVVHEVYGEIVAPLNISSRRDVERFLEEMKKGQISPLKRLTSDYHYHTVEAGDQETLQYIENKLKKKGYLAE